MVDGKPKHSLDDLQDEQLEFDGQEELKSPPQRLEKLPAGWDILADRGFAGTSPYYPHVNPQITPYFLDGRLQFQEMEDQDFEAFTQFMRFVIRAKGLK